MRMSMKNLAASSRPDMNGWVYVGRGVEFPGLGDLYLWLKRFLQGGGWCSSVPVYHLI
jgi:hypothetical protein